MSLTIWCNAKLADRAEARLREALKAGGHRLVEAKVANASVLAGGERDEGIAGADVAFGQPAVEDCFRCERLKWIALTAAGYTRYDREDLKEALRARGGALTNASAVFADPCAQHVLAMMLGLARRLPESLDAQRGARTWDYHERRAASRLLTGQTVLMLGFGAIGRRLAELLAPFRMRVMALRRRTRSESGVRIIAMEQLSSALGEADHVVNILPDNDGTKDFVNARRLACVKKGARFYNVGRGTTVDQRALIEALESGRLDAAYLDVMDPEPPPPEHVLWSTRNCFITPHTAGGRHDQDEALVELFLRNLAAWESGGELENRVV
jgi:Phosphoglycerate dehydrogenase and related dehydrogenases